MICANEALRGLPMNDRNLLVQTARDIVQGMRMTARGGIPDIKPKRPGICAVERCARMIEVSCGGCRETSCQRCLIAAELRAAEDRINDERDAELAELGLDDQSVDEIVDKIVEGLCDVHAPLKTMIVEEWYSRKIYTVPSTTEESCS